MSTTRVLVDSNILILASIGHLDMRTILARYDEVLVSIVSEVEVLGFLFPTPAEEGVMRQALAATTIVSFTSAEAQHAIARRKLKKNQVPRRGYSGDGPRGRGRLTNAEHGRLSGPRRGRAGAHHSGALATFLRAGLPAAAWAFYRPCQKGRLERRAGFG